jgi:hypothetical protein
MNNSDSSTPSKKTAINHTVQAGITDRRNTVMVQGTSSFRRFSKVSNAFRYNSFADMMIAITSQLERSE